MAGAARLVRPIAAALAILLLGAGAALFWRPPGAAGVSEGIVIERAALRPAEQGWTLDALADVQLPVAVRRGLDSGVPLDFRVELQLRQPRRFWFDRTQQAGLWRFRLVYYDLTRHYRLGTPDSDEARNFRSLLSALEGLGDLRGLTVEDARFSGRVEAVLSFSLNTATLPLPLQPLVSTSWRLRATPHRWVAGAERGA